MLSQLENTMFEWVMCESVWWKRLNIKYNHDVY